jgi:predicted ATP-dependent serine protease
MMIAGPPGGGKTFLALDAALKMNVPTLYLSCDSDELTMVTRAAAAVTGHRQRDVKETLRLGLFKEVYGKWLRNSPLKIEFDPSNPTFQDIAYILEAYHEMEGQYPKLIILDNVMNLESDTDNEWAGIRKASKDLHWLARKTKACLVALHHTSEPDAKYADKKQLAPPRSAIQGKISQMSPVILTVDTDGALMWVAVVKNRFGQADKNANDPLRFMVDLSRARIWDEPEMVSRARGAGNGFVSEFAEEVGKLQWLAS